MTPTAPQHLRILQPHPGIWAYYDGRVAGHRFLAGPNWVDDGAISLGIASYAIVEGDQALVYDTHVSQAHGAAIRSHLEGLGVRHFTVVYSHWHLDHVAGTAAFAGARVIANTRTQTHLRCHRAAIEDGGLSGPPVIRPLVLPTQVFTDELSFRFGTRELRLIAANIHSDDATVLWLADDRILLAGDTVEDCATYVDDPADFTLHLSDLARLSALKPAHVLPAHGDATVIGAGGYGPQIIPATQDYIRWLMSLDLCADQAGRSLQEVAAEAFSAGTLRWFAPYEEVHQQNIARTLAHFQQSRQ